MSQLEEAENFKKIICFNNSSARMCFLSIRWKGSWRENEVEEEGHCIALYLHLFVLEFHLG